MKKFVKIFLIFSMSFWITIIRLSLYIPVKAVNNANTLEYVNIIEFRNRMGITQTCIDCMTYEIDINKYRIEAITVFTICIIISIIIYVVVRKLLKNRHKNSIVEQKIK